MTETSPAPNSDAAPPPSFTKPTNVIDLVSIDASKIIGVSLYSSRAEVTRLFKLDAATGLNQINISGLPNVLDRDSLRVEGRGAATIHDVVISEDAADPVAKTSPLLEDLQAKIETTKNAIKRSKKGLGSLETYLTTVHTQHNKATELKDILTEYHSTAAFWDAEVLRLEKELKGLEKDVEEERQKLAKTGKDDNEHLRKVKVSVGVFADAAGEIEIALIYGVNSANWIAGYDIRAQMDKTSKPISLIYKAIITQSTGEDWVDVPLTLETASPSFGLGIPELSQWNISIYRAPKYYRHTKSASVFPSMSIGSQVSQLRGAMLENIESSSAALGGGPPGRSVQYDFALPDDLKREALKMRGADVSSKGNVTATFDVPGLVSIPSDGASHNFTIVKLDLDAVFTWLAVPKLEKKVHIKALIKNTSEYALLSGQGSVYVDGSFIARTSVPAVSPLESFECSLGLDPSIRITYHPLLKKLSEKGTILSYNKTSTYIFTQRISVHNTKTVAVDNLKIIDQVPVSEDSDVTVKLVSPALVPPPASSASSGGISSVSKKSSSGSGVPPPPPAPLRVGDGVLAQWDGVDASSDAAAAPNNNANDWDASNQQWPKDGKLNWLVNVPSQGKVNVSLQWEVVTPARMAIMGLGAFDD